MAVTRTKNVHKPSVPVDVTSEDNLLYKVTVRGATPAQFTLVDAVTHQTLWSNTDGPTSTSPDFSYERVWPRPGDNVAAQTSHTMGFQFLGVRHLKYEVILRHLIGPPDVIFDIDYDTTDDADSHFEDLLITTF